MSLPEGSPFHAGEQAVQAREGVREMVESFGRRMIRSAMPDQHRALFAELPTVVLGFLDGAGRPWASMLGGRPGFVHSPDPSTLRIEALPRADEPARAGLYGGAPVAVLGLQHPTRRRNRANGRIAALDDSGFAVHVEQSFGNCPQYIAVREVAWDASALEPVAVELESFVARIDTFFIASAGAARSDDAREGVDVSHRGGAPGFVRVPRPGTLEWPDYPGNNLYNTLGNLAAYPRAGLTFVDFEQHALLAVTGTAEVRGTGDQRRVRLVVEDARAWGRARVLRT